MKLCSPQLVSFLENNRSFFRADLIEFKMARWPLTFRFTSAPVAYNDGENIWTPAGKNGTPNYSRERIVQSCALQIDELELTLLGPAWIDRDIGFNFDGIGMALGAASLAGVFDGGEIRVWTAILPTPGDWTLAPFPLSFAGRISSSEPRAQDVVLRCFSFLADLRQTLPRYYFRPSCGNYLFDSCCGLDRKDWEEEGEITSIVDSRTFYSETPALAGKETGYFDYGAVYFPTTEESVSIESHVAVNSKAKIVLASDPLTTIEEELEIVVIPGCNKTIARCEFFLNRSNFRGFVKIPNQEAKNG